VEVSIRDAQPSDAARISELLTPRGYPGDGQATAGRLVDWDQDPLSRCLVVDENSRRQRR
jgi:hypothetical protein